MIQSIPTTSLPEFIIFLGIVLLLVIDALKAPTHTISFLYFTTLSFAFIAVIKDFSASKSSIIKIVFLSTFFLIATYKDNFSSIDRRKIVSFYFGSFFLSMGIMISSRAENLLILLLAIQCFFLGALLISNSINNNLEKSIILPDFFALGGLGSCLSFFGLAIIYGASGTMELSQIAISIMNSRVSEDLLLTGLLLFFLGVFVQSLLSTFHIWKIKLIRGADVRVILSLICSSAFLLITILFKVLTEGFLFFEVEWRQFLEFLATIFLIGGAWSALMQNDMKRILAFSGIFKLGSLLLFSSQTTDSNFSYIPIELLSYLLSMTGILLLFHHIFSKNTYSLDEINGAYFSKPIVSLSLLWFLLNYSNFPFLSGFSAKLNILKNLNDSSFLIFLIVIFSHLIIFYKILNVAKRIFSESNLVTLELQIDFSWQTKLGLVVSFSGLVYLTLFSSKIVSLFSTVAYSS